LIGGVDDLCQTGKIRDVTGDLVRQQVHVAGRKRIYRFRLLRRAISKWYMGSHLAQIEWTTWNCMLPPKQTATPQR